MGALSSRIRRLQQKAGKAKASRTCRVLLLKPGEPMPKATPAIVGKLKVLPVSTFGNDSEWERVARIQQRRLTSGEYIAERRGEVFDPEKHGPKREQKREHVQRDSVPADMVNQLSEQAPNLKELFKGMRR